MGSRTGAITRATEYIDSGAFEADLARRVAIPTESQTPEGLPHLTRYLDEEMIPALEAIGFTCRKYDNPVAGCGPVLLATRQEDAAAADRARLWPWRRHTRSRRSVDEGRRPVEDGSATAIASTDAERPTTRASTRSTSLP